MLLHAEEDKPRDAPNVSRRQDVHAEREQRDAEREQHDAAEVLHEVPREPQVHRPSERLRVRQVHRDRPYRRAPP